MKHPLFLLPLAFVTVCSAATQEIGGKVYVTYHPEQWTVDARSSESGQEGIVLTRPDGTKVLVAIIPLASKPAALTDAKARASFMRGMGNEKITSAEAETRIKTVSVFGRSGYELTGTTELPARTGSYRAVMVPDGTDAIVAIFVTPAPDLMAVADLKAIWDSIKFRASPVSAKK